MFRANVYEPLDRGMIILQLCCRKLLDKETLWHFIRLKLHFSKKTKKIALLSPNGGLRGNVHIAFIARWKAHSRLCIRHN